MFVRILPRRIGRTLREPPEAADFCIYPAAMLRARCSAALLRAVYPDLALGVYEQDEAEEFKGQPAAVAPPRPARRR